MKLVLRVISNGRERINLKILNILRTLRLDRVRISNLENEMKKLKVELRTYELYKDRLPFINEATFQQMTFLESLRKYLAVPEEQVALQRFGRNRDGGYVLATIKNPVYRIFSAGAGDDISFEEEISSVSTLIILVDHTFESIVSSNKRIEFRSAKLIPDSFPKESIACISISEVVNSWPKIEGESWILKVDIEGDEWEVFDNASVHDLRKFSQILVEFHGLADAVYFPELAKKVILVFEKLSLNFVPTNLHANNHTQPLFHGLAAYPDVLEVTYVSKELFESLPKVKESEIVNYPNNPYKPDIPRIYSPLF